MERINQEHVAQKVKKVKKINKLFPFTFPFILYSLNSIKK